MASACAGSPRAAASRATHLLPLSCSSTGTVPLPDIVVAADPQVVSWGGTSPDGRAVTGSLPTMKRLFNPNNTDED